MELVSGQPHGVGARVGALCGHILVKALELHILFRVIQLVAGRRIISKDAVLLAVIRHGFIESRDRYRHFVRDRRDLQRAFGLFDCVVVRLRAFVQRIGERIIALANNRLASRHVVRRAFVLRKAVAAYRHFAVRQRIAVVDLAVRSGGQRHRALSDRQAAVRHNKRHVREVRIRVLEVRSFPPHGVGARIRSSRSLSVLIPEVRHFVLGFYVQRVADVDNIILPSRIHYN